MLKVMGYDELAEDPEFSAPMFATAQVETRMELLHEWCEERTVKEVEAALVDADIPVGRAMSIPEVLEDRQIWDREVMMEADVDEPGARKCWCRVQLSSSIRRPPPPPVPFPSTESTTRRFSTSYWGLTTVN